ncbi:hypothetical protein N7532_000104 [Penicillium argentinense]|uniref:Alpha/beta hydrolase fold-3 domain-containing protein n=1 Tax=Penicillium argentinense TaxID=1131581 RepID=A0A9W9G4J9_9EURO|nr:uncharacterized protein N7532_000104 [Penicillium argentinense]KAJ5112059.1 hypothetical protein N7532_000104 [Penicillium argentinense]
MASTDPKLTGFDLIQTTYKHINTHSIRADILIPQAPHAGPRPVILRYHGGGLLMGDSLFMMFFPHWLADLALAHGAVIVSPNYRLLPEATSPEIYADIEDFWTWMHSSAFTDLLATHSTPTAADLNRILTAGDSAGGLLSVYTALAHAPQIRASTASYPWIDPGSEAFMTARAMPPFGNSTPEKIYDDYMKTVKFGSPKSSVDSMESLTIMCAAVEYGHLGGLYARDTDGVPRETLYPKARLEQKDVQIPRGGLAIIHGGDDTVIPVADSEEFVKRANEFTSHLPGPGVTLTVRDGEHGFDSGLRWHEEEWMREAFKEAVRAWLE